MKKSVILSLTAAVSLFAIGAAGYGGSRFRAPAIKANAEGTPTTVPDKVTDVSASFENGSTTGTISFTMPVKLYSATAPAVGWTKYRINEANKYPEVTYAEDYADFGECVDATVTLPAGYHTLMVYAVNEKGKSSPAPGYPYLQVYVGPGKPDKVKNLRLEANGNTMNLSWDAVTAATHNMAFFKADEVTYTVTRTPGDVVVATNISETSFSETLQPTDNAVGYRYEVTAAFRGEVSDPVYSNGAPLGTSAAPWSTDLATIEDFLKFTADPSADSYTWQWDAVNSRAVLKTNSFSSPPGNDDWLITPGLRVEAGKLYPVSFRLSSYSKTYTNTIEIKAGPGPRAEAMTIGVLDPTPVNTPDATRPMAQEVKCYFLAPETGVYHIGLHDITSVKTYDSYAYGFAIGAGIAPTAPECVTDITITSDVDVKPSTAVISFKAPSTDISGSQLSSLTAVKIYRGDLLVKTFENVIPGAALTFSDVLDGDDKGTFVYTFVAENASGQGRSVEKEAYVGDWRLHPPYSEPFEGNDIPDGFTIVDVDQAGTSYAWQFDRSNKAMTCNSTSSKPCDDWLILPSMWLSGGYRYTFTVEVKSYYNGDKVPFEVYFGSGDTPGDFTEKIGELSEAESNIGNTYRTLSYTADPTADGFYNFAIRYLASGYGCKICVNRVEVSSGLNVGEPAAITDLTAVADFDGAMKVDISFTSPATSMAGVPLTSLGRIELYRDETLIHTFTNPACGVALTFEDTGMTPGRHTYRVVPFGTTEGETTSAEVFVGANVPTSPTAATVVEDADSQGMVTLSWQAPQTDVDGAPINPALVSYDIYAKSVMGLEPELVFEGITATSHTFRAVDEGEQHFVYYGVYARTEAGRSEKCADTDVIAAGTPHAMPFVESFVDGYLGYDFNSERIGDYPAEWIVFSDRDFVNLVPQDADNGIIGLYAPYTQAVSRLETGKIDLADADNPQVSVWFRAVKDSQSKVALQVRANGETEYVTLAEKPFWQTGYPEGWVKIQASLAPYAGQTVQIGVVGTVHAQNYLFFDNLRVTQQYDHNLKAVAIQAPARMYPNEEATLAVRYQNLGSMPAAAGSYSIDLYRNGEKVQSVPGPLVDADQTATVEFSQTVGVHSDQQLAYHAEIVYAPDQVPADNATGQADVTVRLPWMPAVSDLSGTSTAGVNSLRWSAPDLSVPDGRPAPVTETFEAFDPFAKADLDDWKLVDADGEPFGGFGQQVLPGINGPISWFVLDNTYDEISYDPQGLLKAHSGSKYLVSAWVDGATGVNNDWLISPMVSATSNQMSLWAKSYDPTMLETFEVLYSTTDRTVDAFKRIRVVADVPATWTKYDFTLPEGTRYFAVR